MAKVQKKKCLDCQKSKSLTDFYMSRSNFSKDGRVDYCKNCLTKNLNCEDIETVLNVLRIMDYPFIEEEWNSTFEKYGKDTTFGNYLRKVGLRQWKDKHYSDSVFLSDKDKKAEKEIDDKIKTSSPEIEELKDKWGFGYTDEEYIAFEKKYNMLSLSYNVRTSMHQEALMNYVRYRVKEEIATALGNTKDAKDWGSLAKGASEMAKLNPKQLSASDLQDGITTFGQLVREIELAEDVIPILPIFLKKPQDDVDFTIWQYINYERNLHGLPLCEYEDIYKFLEQRKIDFENSAKLLYESGDADE